MAVFTPVSRDAAAGFLDAYDLGRIHSFKAIPEGMENTNYRLEMGAGHFILTLFDMIRRLWWCRKTRWSI